MEKELVILNVIKKGENVNYLLVYIEQKIFDFWWVPISSADKVSND